MHADLLLNVLLGRYQALILGTASLSDETYNFYSVLQARQQQLPIIVVGDIGDPRMVLRFLDAGATDFLKSSICLAELAARVRAHIRSYRASSAQTMRFGQYRLELLPKLLFDYSRQRYMRLTDKEVTILRTLSRHSPASVSHEVLVEAIANRDDRVKTHEIPTYIYRLRAKMAPDVNFIMTQPGGYRLKLM